MDIQRLTTPSRPFFLAIFLICALSLTAALTGEHVFGLRPCLLCLYERIPYVIGGAVAAAMILLPTSPRLRFLGVTLCLLAFLGNTGLGIYHVGVEYQWWAAPACTGDVSSASLDDLRAALSQPAPPACDEVQWTLFGISLAGYNTVLSAALAAFCTLGIRRHRREAKA